MVEEWKIAYFAGIIDGEGSIIIAKQAIRKGRKNHTYSLRICVVNSNKILLEWLRSNFGGSIHPLINKKTGKTYYQWIVGQGDTYNLLQKIDPYTVIKKDQVDLAIEFYKKTQHLVNTGKIIPIWLDNKREDFFQRMKKLHL